MGLKIVASKLKQKHTGGAEKARKTMCDKGPAKWSAREARRRPSSGICDKGHAKRRVKQLG